MLAVFEVLYGRLARPEPSELM